jgi:hypothetical protein
MPHRELVPEMVSLRAAASPEPPPWPTENQPYSTVMSFVSRLTPTPSPSDGSVSLTTSV